MNISKLTIDNFGSISRIEAFPNYINVIDDPGVFTAALIVSRNTYGMQRMKIPRFEESTRVCAELSDGENLYPVEIRYHPRTPHNMAVDHCDDRTFYRNIEEQRASFFDGGVYSDVLGKYKIATDEREKRSLKKRTDRVGATGTFRRFLRMFIEENSEFPISKEKGIVAVADENGRYVPRKDGAPHALSETESILFEYTSFLLMGRFWAEFGKMRDMNRTEMPLFIPDITQKFDPSIASIDKVISLAAKAGRQVFILKGKMKNGI